MMEKGLAEDKWFHIPNGIQIDESVTTMNLSLDYVKVFEEIKLAGKTIVGYTGGHAISNSLHTIVESARLMQSNDKIQFVFVGNGQEKQNLIEQAKGLENVIFLDPVPKSQIHEILTKMDILLITWNKSPLYRFGISPNKIFDYMMAAKPVIHATDAPNTFVDEAGCGIAIPPENPNALANAIVMLHNTSKDELKMMGDNGKKYVVEMHAYRILANRFIQIISNI
jgi:glycosyltransferase involved in cell wall biosynthesis